MYEVKNKEKALDYFVKNMLNRSLQIFEYNGLPETLPQIEIERLFQKNGYVVFAEVNGGIYGFKCGFSGEELDPYNRPTKAIITSPSLKFNKTLDLNKDCVLIKNDDNMLGIQWIFEKYGSLINETDITLLVANYNRRIQTLISTGDSETKESAELYLKHIVDGELGVVGEQSLFDSFKVQNKNLGGGNSVSDIVELQQYFKATMFNEIGLNANYNMKRERLNTSEVRMNDDSLFPLIDNMLENRQNGIKLLNEMFSLNVSVELSSVWKTKRDEYFLDESEVSEEPEETKESKMIHALYQSVFGSDYQNSSELDEETKQELLEMEDDSEDNLENEIEETKEPEEPEESKEIIENKTKRKEE